MKKLIFLLSLCVCFVISANAQDHPHHTAMHHHRMHHHMMHHRMHHRMHHTMHRNQPPMKH